VIHLSKNIKQATILHGFGAKARPSPENRGKLASECALYMVHKVREGLQNRLLAAPKP
jgi:hypothetical protein